jgi:uncharacterized phiE125 gp8 family phage protein
VYYWAHTRHLDRRGEPHHKAYALEEGPAVEPVSRAEAKNWCRVDADLTADDDDFDQLIAEARARAERVTGRALVTQSWRLRMDAFPCRREPLVVDLPPLASVEGITYVDADGATQTLSPSAYQVDLDSRPARIAPAYGHDWPGTRHQLNAVTVAFTAGASADLVDPEFVGRMKACVCHCHRRREDRDEAWLDKLFSSLWTGTL